MGRRQPKRSQSIVSNYLYLNHILALSKAVATSQTLVVTNSRELQKNDSSLEVGQLGMLLRILVLINGSLSQVEDFQNGEATHGISIYELNILDKVFPRFFFRKSFVAIISCSKRMSIHRCKPFQKGNCSFRLKNVKSISILQGLTICFGPHRKQYSRG